MDVTVDLKTGVAAIADVLAATADGGGGNGANSAAFVVSGAGRHVDCCLMFVLIDGSWYVKKGSTRSREGGWLRRRKVGCRGKR